MRMLLPVIVVFVAGCSIITPPTYHETEYSNLIEIAAEASEGVCSDAQKERLAALALRSTLYSKYLPHNELMAEGTEKLNETVEALRSNKAPSPSYCQLKLRLIKTMATTLAGAVGGKSK